MSGTTSTGGETGGKAGSNQAGSNQAGSRTNDPAEYLKTREERRTERGFYDETDDERRERKRRKAERREVRAGQQERAMRRMRALVRWLPMPVACALGATIGYCVGLFPSRSVLRTRAHLDLALGDETTPRQRRAMARRVYANLVRGVFALCVAHRMGPERALKYVRVTGQENYDAALSDGKGVVILSLHAGNFELGGCWLGTCLGGKSVGRPVGSVDAGATKVLIEMRNQLGNETVERGNPRELFRHLKRGKPVGLVADQDLSDANGVFLPYFGILAHTAVGPATISMRTGAPMVGLFVEWEGLTRSRVVLHPPLRPNPDLPDDEAAADLMDRYTRLVETHVRRVPTQWLWMHKRWETRPVDRPEQAVYDPRGEARVQ